MQGGPSSVQSPLALRAAGTLMDHLAARLRVAIAAADAALEADDPASAGRWRPWRRLAGRYVLRRQLHAALAEVDEDIAELRRSIAEETAAADDWDRRARLATANGQHELARQDRDRHRGFGTSAATLGRERARLEALRSAYGEALAALERPEGSAR